MAEKKCTYLYGCDKLVNAPHDDKLCVFHITKEKKGLSVEEFNELIFERIKEKKYNFSGFVFPYNFSFFDSIKKIPIKFDDKVNFSNARFEGDVDFNGTEFLDDIDF